MSKKHQKRRDRRTRVPRNSSSESGTQKPLPEPIDIVDGIPDHARNPSRRRLGVVLIVFVTWVAFLLYCLLAARAVN